MKALIVLAAIAGILIFLGLIPVGCAARYDGRPQLQLTVGPLHFSLYPQSERHKRKKEKKAAKTPKKKRKKTSTKKRQATEPAKKPNLAAFKPLIGTLLDLLGRVRRAVRVKLLSVRVCFGAEDAAQRAIRYGQAWAVIGSITPLLENAFTIKNRDMQVVFDPNAESFTIELELRASIRIGAVILIGLRCGTRTLLQLYQIKTKKAVQKS